MLLLSCDRCDICEPNPDIEGVEPHPALQHGLRPARVVIPEGWTLVDGHHLCKRCSISLREFLAPLPRAAEARG